jgi:hypothetical protein
MSNSNIINIKDIVTINETISKDSLIFIRIKTSYWTRTSYRIFEKVNKELNRLCPGRFVNIQVIQKYRKNLPKYGRILNSDGIDDSIHPDEYDYSITFERIDKKVIKKKFSYKIDELSSNEYQMTFTGDLLINDNDNQIKVTNITTTKKFKDHEECPICLRNYNQIFKVSIIAYPCGHNICFNCFTKLIKKDNNICSICRQSI